MPENNRIKEIRKSPQINLTLEDFGARIGLKKSSLSMIENGKSSVTEQLRKSICREFNVNEDWLRTGNGEMFNKTADDYLSQKCREHGFNDSEEKLLRLLVDVFLNMSPEQRAYLNSEILKITGADSPAAASALETAEEAYIKSSYGSAPLPGEGSSLSNTEDAI